jgi:hypothetical protein
MWSYEIIYEYEDRGTKKKSKERPSIIQSSEVVVADSGEKALKYALDRITEFDDYELVGVIRRHPIVMILK